MRSRSSLLSHILGSNPNIIGYSELHLSYLTWKDLLRLRVNAYLNIREHLHDKYILDKILHNSHSISRNMFEAQNTKFIFLLREPEATIKSIINMSCIYGIDYYKDPGNALDYYHSRLSMMKYYASMNRTNGLFIESDDLINNTDAVLDDLSNWLGLKTALNAKYSIFKNTGKFGYGDPLGNIKSGKILKTNGHKEIHVPSTLLKKGKDAYESCKKNLKRNFYGNSTKI